MNSRIKIIGFLLVMAIAGTILGYIGTRDSGASVLGGLTSDSFTPKVITSTNVSATVPVIVHGGAGVFGNIIIGSSSPATTLPIRIYDGSATSSTDRTGTSTGSLIGVIKPSSSEQSIEVNVAFTKGLVLDVPPGYNGTIIFTHK